MFDIMDCGLGDNTPDLRVKVGPLCAFLNYLFAFLQDVLVKRVAGSCIPHGGGVVPRELCDGSFEILADWIALSKFLDLSHQSTCNLFRRSVPVALIKIPCRKEDRHDDP